MNDPKMVLFASKERAEARTGFFRVSSLMISCELAERISAYIARNKLQTFYRKNKRGTSNNRYTLNFTLKQYVHIENPKAYLSKPGALGPNPNKRLNIGINPTPAEASLRAIFMANREQERELRARSPTLEQMYFWIVRKYPEDLLWMDYSTEPDAFSDDPIDDA